MLAANLFFKLIKEVRIIGSALSETLVGVVLVKNLTSKNRNAFRSDASLVQIFAVSAKNI